MTETEITRERALAIAQAICRQREWPWLEPVEATARSGRWTVRTNAAARGANAVITIDTADGRVLEATYRPR